MTSIKANQFPVYNAYDPLLSLTKDPFFACQMENVDFTEEVNFCVI